VTAVAWNPQHLLLSVAAEEVGITGKPWKNHQAKTWKDGNLPQKDADWLIVSMFF